MLKTFFTILCAIYSSFATAELSDVKDIATIEDYSFITEEFPPYNYADPFNTATGINTDVLVEIFKELGVDKSVNDIKIWPWARGYREILNPNSHMALYSVARTKSREGLFKWVGPMSAANNAIIVKKGNPRNIKINEYEDFKQNIIFGAIRDDLGHQTLLRYKVPQKSINLSSSMTNLLKMLEAGRVDAISYSHDVFLWLAVQNSYANYDVIFSEEVGSHYIAFPRKTPNHVINNYQKALDKVINNKAVMDKINQKYSQKIVTEH